MTDQKDRSAIVNALAAMMNATSRRVSALFPGYFDEAKHNHYRDFGWPQNVTFSQIYAMYCRNGLARAAVKKTARKVWQDHPFLMEREEAHDETPVEADIRQRFADLRIWQRLAEADRRSMVGAYAGVILRLADDRRFAEPVDSVRGGLDGLVEIIPAWEGQLRVSTWDDDEMSETYGQPTMFQFNEAQVGNNAQGRNRAFEVHPDRVIVWSEDGTVHGRSMLEPGFNDLLTLEKITGAGGEGFWKNAKSSPVFEIDKEAQLSQMAQAMGVEASEIADALNTQTENWQKGFDQSLMLQGMKATTLGVTLPIPEHFRAGALENFAASVEMPKKILTGMQTGERASTEDASEWAQTCMGIRSDRVIPAIMEFVNRLERFGILPERDWFLSWADLTEAGIGEKIDRADKMASINERASRTGLGEVVFTSDEIRETVGKEPLSESDAFTDDDEADMEPPNDGEE
ncbi:phage portal protein [uncultured Mameliella sp.]|uniref:anti-CBASS protein Acb1 family protein n=1 Tax=uncultured Mameliella sp. TaxID=1447087 RepID=UPI002621DCAB|nr:anti-CBASS Acb1 family protein [uncultured Mameliella sp.]